MSQAEGEKWIVNLIRDTRMGADAKIDLEKVRICHGIIDTRPYCLIFLQNMVTTHRTHPPVYQSVIEKTRGLARRTQDLSIDMNRRANGEYDAASRGGGGVGGGPSDKENKNKGTGTGGGRGRREEVN